MKNYWIESNKKNQIFLRFEIIGEFKACEVEAWLSSGTGGSKHLYLESDNLSFVKWCSNLRYARSWDQTSPLHLHCDGMFWVYKENLKNLIHSVVLQSIVVHSTTTVNANKTNLIIDAAGPQLYDKTLQTHLYDFSRRRIFYKK